jgi:hypothetical protein
MKLNSSQAKNLMNISEQDKLNKDKNKEKLFLTKTKTSSTKVKPSATQSASSKTQDKHILNEVKETQLHPNEELPSEVPLLSKTEETSHSDILKMFENNTEGVTVKLLI